MEDVFDVEELLESLTPINFLAIQDFLKDIKSDILLEFVDEIDYSVAEY